MANNSQRLNPKGIHAKYASLLIERANDKIAINELETRVGRQEEIILRLWPQIAGMESKLARIAKGLVSTTASPKQTARDKARSKAEALFSCGEGRTAGTLQLKKGEKT